MILRFADCSLDLGRHEVTRDGVPVHVEPQVFDVLVALARANGDVVSRDALVDCVWNGLAVSDATISARISAARQAVGDTGAAQRIIRTVPRRGFALAVQVLDKAETALPAPDGDVTRQDAAPQAEAQTQDIRITTSADGHQIAWARSGTGPPLVRASHWLSHLEMDWASPTWGPVLRDLGARHTLLRYDQRGTGLSGRRIGDGDLGEFVADLKAVIDAAGVDRVPIYAASQATPVALRFAAENPDRVSRLDLVGAYAQGRAFRAPDEEDVDEETVLTLIQKGWGRSGSTFVRAMTSLFMPDATPEQVSDFVKIQLASASPENAVAIRRAVDRFNVVDVLGEVRAPVLLLHAAGDVIHPVSQARLLAGALPDARLHIFESANHVTLPQHPSWTEMLRHIEAFLAENDPPISV